jgi:hypothetical protein
MNGRGNALIVSTESNGKGMKRKLWAQWRSWAVIGSAWRGQRIDLSN